MKFSNFNITKKVGDEMLIYNTLSGSILHLNSQYTHYYNELLKSDIIDTDKQSLIMNLVKGKMLIEDDFDEIKSVIAQNNILRFSNYHYNLTIAPTMQCNFICPYCYEKGREYSTMDEVTIINVKKFINELRENSQSLSITWYGGEPLLAFDIIRALSEEAINCFGRKYHSNIVTNGYYLTKEIVMQFDYLHIEHIQITLDGPPELHNKRRQLPTGEDTFFVILDNIKEAVNINSQINITIRVNADKTNIEYVDSILDYLDEYKLSDKVGLYLAPVDNNNKNCNQSLCFSEREFAVEQMKFIERNLKNGYNFAHLPNKNLNICGAVALNSYVIDSKGQLFKCWEDVGICDEKVGEINKSVHYNNKNLTKWLSYNLLECEKCLKCAFMPICMGGCPNQYLKTKKNKCIPLKNNIDKMIDFIYLYSSRSKS